MSCFKINEANKLDGPIPMTKKFNSFDNKKLELKEMITKSKQIAEIFKGESLSE